MPETITFAEIHEKVKRRAGAPVKVGRTTCLTPKGTTVVMVLNLERTLRELPRADRAYIVRRLRDMLADVATS